MTSSGQNRRLAKQIGISDVAIAKHCRKPKWRINKSPAILFCMDEFQAGTMELRSGVFQGGRTGRSTCDPQSFRWYLVASPASRFPRQRRLSMVCDLHQNERRSVLLLHQLSAVHGHDERDRGNLRSESP